MTDKSNSYYSAVAIRLHWLIALLMIGNLLGGLFHEAFGEANVGLIMGLHKSTGILILVLSVIRLAWRLGHRPPPLAPTLKKWEVGLAHATHWTFYFLMLALPMTGWLLSSASVKRWPLDFYGLFPVPFLPVEQSKAFAGVMHERHEFLGFLCIALIVLHIVAAIKHQVMDGDNTVERMLPLVKARNSSN
jgi:cytochrome b561